MTTFPECAQRAGLPLASAQDRGSRVDTRSRLLAWLLTGGLALFYAVFAVARHDRLDTSGFDLGIFEQEVSSYAHLHWPTSLLKGPHVELLGDHFSPAMAVIAPIYRLWPGPQTLLVAQAILVALGVWPLVRRSAEEFGAWAACVVGVAYGLSWGVAEAIGFDVHEVMLAVPLIAFSAVALSEGRHRAAVLWMAPVVLVKEDLGLTLAALGLLVALRGRVRLGTATAVAGVAATVVETYVVLPAVSGTSNGYTAQITWHSALHLATPETKLSTIALVLAPTAFLAVRSSITLLAVPTLLWRMSSSNPAYWGTTDHYSLVLMPIVFAAGVEALRGIDPARRRRWLLAVLAVTAAQIQNHPFVDARHLLVADPRAAGVRRLLRSIPDGCSVSASNWLAPQLTTRHPVSLFGGTPLDIARPDFIAVDVRTTRRFPLDAAQQAHALGVARTIGYRLAAFRDGVEVLSDDQAGCESLRS